MCRYVTVVCIVNHLMVFPEILSCERSHSKKETIGMFEHTGKDNIKMDLKRSRLERCVLY
jgi:hypothetical protein